MTASGEIFRWELMSPSVAKRLSSEIHLVNCCHLLVDTRLLSALFRLGAVSSALTVDLREQLTINSHKNIESVPGVRTLFWMGAKLLSRCRAPLQQYGVGCRRFRCFGEENIGIWSYNAHLTQMLAKSNVNLLVILTVPLWLLSLKVIKWSFSALKSDSVFSVWISKITKFISSFVR